MLPQKSCMFIVLAVYLDIISMTKYDLFFKLLYLYRKITLGCFFPIYIYILLEFEKFIPTLCLFHLISTMLICYFGIKQHYKSKSSYRDRSHER